MFKKEISYTDYDGNQRKETHYFNMNQAELTELELSTEGSFTGLLKSIIEAQNVSKLMDIFKKMITMSHGQKSPDGKRFIKDKAFTEEFMQTEGYVNFYMELATNTEAALAFVKGIMPPVSKEREKEIDSEIARLAAENA